MNLSFPPTSLDLLRLSSLPSPAISPLSLPFIPTTFVHNVLPILVKFTKPDSKSGLWQAGRHHRTLSKLRLSDRIFILPLTANYSVFTCSASTHLCMCKYLKSTYTYIGIKFLIGFISHIFFFFFFAIVGKKVSLYRIGSFLSVNFKMRERRKKRKGSSEHRSYLYFYLLFIILFRSKVWQGMIKVSKRAKCQENKNNGMNRTIDRYNNTMLCYIFIITKYIWAVSGVDVSINFVNRESKETEWFQIHIIRFKINDYLCHKLFML